MSKLSLGSFRAPKLYPRVKGQPQLRDSVVLWLDILGYRNMCVAATSPAAQQTLLSALHRALRTHRPLLVDRHHPFFAERSFTDNIVLGRPVWHDAEMELGHLMIAVGAYQFALVRGGFFSRGAIAFGPHFMDQYMVFGPALIEAYDLEAKHADVPRVLLSEDIQAFVKLHMTYYAGGAASAPHSAEILVDEDHRWFVNYLDAARGDEDPALLPAYAKFVEEHRQIVVAQLAAHADNSHVLRKYEWVADYHNYVCGYLYPKRVKLLIPIGKRKPRVFRRLYEVLPPKKFALGVRPPWAKRQPPPAAKANPQPAAKAKPTAKAKRTP